MIKTFKDLEKGEYRLKVKITSLSPTVISLYSNHRHFLIKEMSVEANAVIEKEYSIALRDADFQKQDNYRDRELNLVADGDCEWEFELTKEDFATIYTMGDSTVCNQECYDGSPMEHCGGWGQALGMFLGGKYAVSNHAEQGTHTANCLECHLIPVLAQIKKGDKVLCQFGHNDQKQEWLKADEGYLENLIKIGTMVQKKGAEFIICTPINRLIYVEGSLNDYLDNYRDACFKAGKALGARVIDLHTFTSETYEKMGSEAENLFYHSPDLDRTHPNDYGAVLIAEFVTKNL